MTPKISISVPSYNYRDYLTECLDSIINQNYPNLELIVMDDGSTDGSVEVIKEREKYISYWQSEPNQGVISMTEGGFKHSTGDIMMSLSSTDMLHPHALQNVGILFKYKGVEWLTGAVNWLTPDGVLNIYPRLRIWSRAKFLSQKQESLCCISTEGTFFTRDLYERAGGYIKNIPAWDFELYARFFRMSYPTTTTGMLGAYRIHGNRVFAEQVYAESAYKVCQDELKRLPLRKDDTCIAEPLIAPISDGAWMKCDPP
jgi:glycosyltransferase involved in cell wall biosynthesis